jgi:hypothetical protein
MVVLDATMLLLLFRPGSAGVRFNSDGKPIDRIEDRVNHLVKTLEAARLRILVPTPVMSEILVKASADEAQKIVEEISRLAVFRPEPFDTLAAIELAAMTRSVLAAGGKKDGVDAPWQKIKIDRQIVAIARVHRATAIYTDDQGIVAAAKRLDINTVGLADLPLPPEVAQKAFDFERKGPDDLDEVARQVETHQPQSPA